MRLILILLLTPLFAFSQTEDEVLRELQRQKVPHAEIVLAQARLESGNFTSDLYQMTHNLLGMKTGEKYTVYKSWRDCIKDYKKRVSSRYTGGSYYDFLKKIGYATDVDYIIKIKKIMKGSQYGTANRKILRTRRLHGKVGRKESGRV